MLPGGVPREGEEQADDPFIGNEAVGPEEEQQQPKLRSSIDHLDTIHLEALVKNFDEGLQPPVTVAQLQEFLAIGRGMRNNCLTLPLTMFMWIAYVLVVFNHGEARGGFESARFIQEALEGCSCASCPTPSGEPLQLHDITSWQQIMPWIEGGMVPMLQKEGQQQLLGYIRVEQTRGEMRGSMDVERKGGELLNANLREFYGETYYPSGKQVGAYGPRKEKYQLDEPAFMPTSSSTNNFRWWVEANRSLEVVSTRVAALASQGWVDLQTQDLVLDGIFLNIQAHIYTHFKIDFVLHREGFVETIAVVKPLRAEIYTHWSQVFMDIIWVTLFAFLAYTAIAEVVTAYTNSTLSIHMKEPSVWIDIVLVIAGATVCMIFWYFMYWILKFTDEVEKIGVMPLYSIAEAPDSMKVGAEVENRVYQDQLLLVLDWMNWFVILVARHRLWTFCYALGIICRFMRGFAGQPRMSVLVQTFLYSAKFITHFMIVLVVVFVNFALGGFILFGEHVEGWSTIASSVSRMIVVLFHRFDYEELAAVAPISAGLWYASFFVLASLLLVRLLTAGILHHYMIVRERLGEAGLGLPAQLVNSVQELWWRRTYAGAQKSVPYDELLRMLSEGMDPALLHKLGQLRVDRRLLTRADLHREEKSPAVDEKFLCERGCDPATARRLLEACTRWTHQISTNSSPARRLMIQVARHMKYIRGSGDTMTNKVKKKMDASSKIVDRIDLKHAKNLALAKRIRKAQELPRGWSVHTDKDGRRYLRQDETGLTSWTLPKHMV